MSSNVQLDDLTQPVVFIPHSGPEGDEQENDAFHESDLDEGEDLRWVAYRTAWTKCFDRVQEIVKTIYEPVIVDVVESVLNAYENDFLGLPYPELPVIALTSLSSSPTFIQKVIERLNMRTKRKKPNCFVAHLFPAECTNMVGTMKALITGFTNQGSARSKGFRSTGHTLAAYDIKVLDAWYREVVEDSEERPQLIVILHDFEQFDSSIAQDFTYICSHQSRTMPLVFMVCLSSPLSPTYLHTSYPHSTLALLRIQQYSIPSGNSVLETIVLDTFASLYYDPTLFLGPVMLEAIVDHFVRYDLSVDSLVNSLQLAHLKHFSINPLTLIHHHTPSREVLQRPSSFPFLDALLYRLHGPDEGDEDVGWRTKSVRDLIRDVDTARSDFYAQTRRVRLAFGLMRLVQEFLEENGYKGLDLEVRGDFPKYTRMYIKLLRGRGVAMDINDIERYLRLLKPQQVSAFLARLRTFLQSLPDNIDIDGATAEAEEFIDEHATDDLFTDEEGLREIADKSASWLSKYLRKWTEQLKEQTLWEVWYTGDAPFPSETINPSVRASVMSGLLRPNEFVSSTDDGGQHEFELWECPDTSILFHRYLESGKMINVYDWFESFNVVLETQRKKLKEKRIASTLEQRKRATVMLIPPKTPRKHNSPKKYGTPKKNVNDNDKTPFRKEAERSISPPLVEEDEEKWDVQVQARFIRALHELDYMGFIKHTKRKQDCVLRTVFDISG